MSNDHAVIIDGRLRLLGTESECRHEYALSLAAYKPEYRDRIALVRLVTVAQGGQEQPERIDLLSGGERIDLLGDPTMFTGAAQPEPLSLSERIERLCEALLANYNLTGSSFGTTFAPEYKAGQKYVRIVYGTGSQRFAHAFVELSTGALIKAAGWKAPAKRSDGSLQSQYNLLDDASFAQVLADCDWAGRYLYLR